MKVLNCVSPGTVRLECGNAGMVDVFLKAVCVMVKASLGFTLSILHLRQIAGIITVEMVRMRKVPFVQTGIVQRVNGGVQQ